MAQHQRKPAATTSGGGRGFTWILIGVAVVGLAAIAWAVWGTAGGDAATGPLEIGSLENTQQLAQKAEPMRKGDPKAPVQIVEFADFQCPACRVYEERTAPALKPYIANGQVEMAFYDFPLVQVHRNAFIAARAARCAAEQKQFWPFHDVLYARQDEWSEKHSPIDQFVQYARQLGMNPDQFKACVESDKYQDVVTANALVGQRLGVQGTPTLFVNGRNALDAWQDPDALRSMVDQQLGGPRAGAADSAASGR